jgi:hypothetical protein
MEDGFKEKRPRGQIRMHERRDGQVTYSLRVRAYGRREILTLGTDTDGWTYRKAECMLDRVLAEIEVGSGGRRARRRSATPIRPSTCSPLAGGRRGKPSSARQRRPTTSGACASTCCPSSPTSVCRTSPSHLSTSSATRRSSSANGSGPSLGHGERSADEERDGSVAMPSSMPQGAWPTVANVVPGPRLGPRCVSGPPRHPKSIDYANTKAPQKRGF